MDSKNTIINLGPDPSTLKKKRKRYKPKEDNEEESISSIKKKKIEITNYLTFPQEPKNNLYDTFSPKINSFSLQKIYTTSSKIKYNYYCQEIIPSDKNIPIMDAKILILENKTILFLLQSYKLLLYEIEENKYYNLIKEINLDQNNSFAFSFAPQNIFLVTPEPKKPKKNDIQNNNNNDNAVVRTKMKIYLCIVSIKEKYLCVFDLKQLIFKKVKNIIPRKGIAQHLINNDMKFKLYNKNKIIIYNNNCSYIQKFFGKKKCINLKMKDIESVSVLNDNLVSICTTDIVYVLDANTEAHLGDFKTLSRDKKAKLIKPDNNLLMVYSSSEVCFYDLESLMFFQKLELHDLLNNTAQKITKAKQLNNNNIAVLLSNSFLVYNLEKNAITFKFDFDDNNNDIINRVLIEMNPNNVLFNNQDNNLFLMNSIKGDKIAYYDNKDNHSSIFKKIKKCEFKYKVTQDKNMEEDKDNKDKTFVLVSNSQSTFMLSSIKED